MKTHTIYLIAVLALGALPAVGSGYADADAQTDRTEKSAKVAATSQSALADTLSDDVVDYRFALGVQVGTDVGGAIPVPFRYIPETFNPYPKLDLSLGAKLTFPVTTRWDLGAEVTYKTITMNADARVENQKFQDKDLIEYYSGTAEMHMDFTMLEIPVYTKYSLRNLKDKLLFGPYFVWVSKSSFVISPEKGYVGMTGPDQVDSPVNNDLDDMDFSPYMDSWDLGLLLGYERKLSRRFELGLRVSMGFKDIFKRDNQYFDYKMLHMRGTVVVSYNLFDIRPPRLLRFAKN